MKDVIEDLRINAALHPLDVDSSVMIRAASAIESQAATIALYETTAENCDLLRAKVDELEAWKAEELSLMNPLMDYARSVCTGKLGSSITEWLVSDHKGMAAKVDEQAREIASKQATINGMNEAHWQVVQELAALKAQPSGVVLPERFEMEPYQTVDKGSSNYKAGFNAAIKQIRESLNQQPVSAGDDALTCDYCGAETEDPWHGSGMLDGAESRHIHACDGCRHMLPSVSAGGVDERPTLGYSVHGNRYMIKATRGEIPNPPYDDRQIIELVDRAALTASAPNHSEQARHMVREGWQLVPVEPGVQMERAGTIKAPGFITLRDACDIYKAMLAAAPSAGSQKEQV